MQYEIYCCCLVNIEGIGIGGFTGLEERVLRLKGLKVLLLLSFVLPSFCFISLLASFQDVSLHASVVHRICHCSLRMKDVSKGH